MVAKLMYADRDLSLERKHKAACWGARNILRHDLDNGYVCVYIYIKINRMLHKVYALYYM